ncbi:histidinol-phosphatase [Desulfofundulus thermobenzoicus]|nr:histidinol-phosphatase [Desulfofundulus thermobenzoicus]
MNAYYMDYHVHPNYSIDAENYSIMDYSRRAVSMGLKEICFTTHLEVDPVRRHRDWFVRVKGELHPMEDTRWLDHYFREIDEARRQMGRQGLIIKAGLEVGYERGCEEAIARVITSFPFDFILGSIHCLEHQAISSREESRLYFPNRTVEEVCQEYFQIMLEAVQTGLFDCIAHLDLYRRHGDRFLGTALKNAHRGRVEPVFTEMARRNMGLEINTSSLRQGLPEFHPARNILLTARELGVRIFTVGSDAHRPDQLGAYIDQAMALLKDLDLPVYTFSARKPSLVRGQNRMSAAG